MTIGLVLWRGLARALAPWGELCGDVLYERSLLDPLPEVIPVAAVTLRQAQPADIDAITRVYLLLCQRGWKGWIWRESP